jgi:hypothetical protein
MQSNQMNKSKTPTLDPDSGNHVVFQERITCSQHPHARPVNELMPEFQKMSEFAATPEPSTVNFGRTWLRRNPTISPASLASFFFWSLSLRQDGAGVEMVYALVSLEDLPGSLKSLLAPPTEDECQLAAKDLTLFLPKLNRLLQIDESTVQRHADPR